MDSVALPAARPRAAASRCLRAVLLVAAATASGAWGQALTEREAIDASLARASFRDALAGATAAAEAEVSAAELWSNPTLDYDLERVSGDRGRSEEQILRLSQVFDISGRRGLRRDAAGRRLDAAQAAAAGREADAVGEVRRVFFETLAGQRRAAAMEAWLGRLVSAEQVVAQLARAGEISGYDRRRLARERVSAEARLASSRAELERSRERLAAQTGRAVAAVAGELLPPPAPPLSGIQAALEARPELRVLEARAAALDQERLAAARGWIPDVTLGAGPKRVTEPDGSADGAVLSVSIPLPLFDRGDAASRRLAGEALAARGELGLARMRAEGEARGLWRQADLLRDTALRFRGDSVEASRDLARIAEAAYRAAEGSILELLDAHRALLDAEGEAIALELAARLARIELDQISGEIPR